MKNLLTILLLFICIYGNAQYKFEYLTTEDGLSTNSIKCIYRDSKDYLWIGTEIGLDKYDSYKIKTYNHNDIQAGTISSSNIVDIAEDSNNNVWIGTVDGLNLYLPESDSFTVFRNNPADIHSIDNNSIFSLFNDSKGNLWISTDGKCLNKWVPETKQFIRYPIENSVGKISINEDSKGNLWFVAAGLPGIKRFDPETGNITSYIDTTINRIRTIKGLYIDKDDLIWITSYQEGLISFDPATEKFRLFNSNGNGLGTNGTFVNSVIEEDNQHLWIGVDQGGINRFDKISETFEYIMYTEEDENGLSNNGVWEIYKDNEGIIWCITSSGGLNIYNPQKKAFKLFRHNINSSNTVSSNMIGCFYEDSQGMIWIGTDNNGLNLFNPQTANFKSYKHDPANSFSISSNTIRCIAEDNNKDLWIGTWISGFNQFKRKTGEFHCYMPDDKDPSSISGTTVWHCIVDHKGIFWLAIHNVGVDLFDKNKGVIKRFTPDQNDAKSLSSIKVWYIFEDTDRNIWLCTDNGLNLYNSIDNSFIVYKHLPSKNIKAIAEDLHKNLWVGTDKGICQIKADGTILQAYNKNNGLAGNIVNGVVCDNNGNIWVSTNNGISKFDTKAKTFENFNKKDGLQDNSFFQQSFLKTRKGEIYFGGYKGFNSFFPDSIKANTTVPPVYITEFQIFNKPVTWGTKDSPLEKHISETKEITLTHLQSVFSFGFTAINYTNPEKNKYAYKMEGFEKEWNYTDATRRYVTYTNLDPGEYVFRVKASNNDGIWNEEGTSIKITIRPPIWKTWWFRAVTLFAIIFSIISYINFRVYQIREQKTLLAKKVKERTIQLEEKQEEIESQNDELNHHRNHLENLVKERTADLVAAMKKAEESNRLKTAFLSNMSHEIRTPMNAIIGFSSLLDNLKLQKRERKELISLIKKNSEALLVLIDDILEMSRIQSNQLVINIEPVNVIEIIKQLFESFKLQTQQKNIELIIDTGNFGDTFICSLDPIRLKQVLSNLISNAIKFTQKGSVKFGFSKQDNGFLTFYVSDSGIGIPKEIGNGVFESFRKVNETETHLFEGVGLGLSISHSLVTVMGGDIWYESSLGRGTKFYFTIPYSEHQ